MATMRQIRTRIRVARNIQQITKAMKMVAAARLKRAQDRVESARPYVSGMAEVVGNLARAGGEGVEHPLLEQRPVQKTGILVLTADRGLCGSYNTAVIRRALELLDGLPSSQVRLMVAGRRGASFFRRRGYTLADIPAVTPGAFTYSDAVALAADLRYLFENGEVDEVVVVYTRFLTAISQEPVVERILPVEPPAAAGVPDGTEFLLEPAGTALVADLLPRFLTTRLYHVLLEATASEHGARMTSMSSATDNAGKMISTLTLSLNRVRQAAITKEISEIVSGAEALKT